MKKRARNLITATLAGAMMVGAGASACSSGADDTKGATAAGDHSPGKVSRELGVSKKQAEDTKNDTEKKSKAEDTKKLPSGVSTATSFWDSATASGKPMSYNTVASPYWPLGTKVKVTYKGKSKVGVVKDFGPAAWAVAQHDPPAIIDLSEKMMADFTGTGSNSVPMHFQVLKMGDGRTYRDAGPGHALAMGTVKGH